ncbi:MAG TPA: hypothetical protein VHE32_02555 [Rhodanobacteraceae bacterium]|nr:hypothetical protein [Rhodanobacteraceae bacterium]
MRAPAHLRDMTSKVPEADSGFWLVKIAATTLGETGADALSMSLGLGYLVSTGFLAITFAIAVCAQIASKRFNPLLYWLAIVATTTIGTTIADFADRSLGIGYAGGSVLLLVLLLASLIAWHRILGTIAIDSVSTPRAETFYWITIMFSQTLGTALGDWISDSAGLGYTGAMAIFGSMLLAVTVVWFRTRVSRTALFWIAFVLTRPLGAVVGDFLDKPVESGGLALSRFGASAVLLALMLAVILLFPQRPARRAH